MATKPAIARAALALLAVLVTAVSLPKPAAAACPQVQVVFAGPTSQAVGDVILLSAQVSGSSPSFTWSVASGPGAGTFNNNHLGAPELMCTGIGNVGVRVDVTASGCPTSTGTTNVSCYDPLSCPVVQAASMAPASNWVGQRMLIETTVTGNPTYTWSVSSGPGNGFFWGPKSDPGFTCSAPGDFTLKLLATKPGCPTASQFLEGTCIAVPLVPAWHHPLVPFGVLLTLGVVVLQLSRRRAA